MIKAVSLKLYLGECSSLKAKRRIIQSLIEKCKKYNVSIAETGELDTWNLSEITFAVVSNSESYNQNIVDKIINLFDNDFRLSIVEIILQ